MPLRYAEYGGVILAGLKWEDTRPGKWVAEHWDAHLAHEAVYRAVERGDLVPQPCEGCGAAYALAHHDSYAVEDRLKVRWLCPSHHRLHHRDHPIGPTLIPPPARRAAPIAEREGPNRGKVFRRYLKPRARNMRVSGFSYPHIAAVLNISVSTAFEWCKET